jgi:hypothetical protein
LANPTFADVDRITRSQSPIAKWEYVDVTFNASANGNTDVRHTLAPADVESVRYLPVKWEFTSAPAAAPIIYRDTSATRRPWGTDYLVLRCNVASAKCRLLCWLEN